VNAGRGSTFAGWLVPSFFLFWALHVADRDDGVERARGLFSEVGAAHSASGGWEMVDAVTETRRRQAAMLKMSL